MRKISTRRAGPRHDVPVLADAFQIQDDGRDKGVPVMWVLLQTAPKLRVLSVCSERNRLSAEMAELVRLWQADSVTKINRAFLLLPANLLAA